MFARLAFACAINVDPDILIVDEVLSVGDMAFQLKCFKKFQQFKESGKTILYRRITDAEKSAKIERTEYNRIISFDELEDMVKAIYLEVNSKVKRIRGKNL